MTRARASVVALGCLLSLFASRARAEGAPRLVRLCDVFEGPTASSRRLCRKRAGTEIESIERAAAGFLKVRVGECKGFVPDACVSSDAVSSGRSARRAVASAGGGPGYRIGLSAGLDGNFGKVPYATTLSSGLGYAAALRFDVPLADRLRLTLSAGYRALKMSREIDGSGSINDLNPAKYTQTLQSGSAQAVLGYFLIADGSADLVGEVGGEFLKPFSAKQTDAAGAETEFPAVDKMVLVLLGLGMDYPLSSGLGLLGQLHGFYNAGASGGTGLFGVRLALTLSFLI